MFGGIFGGMGGGVYNQNYRAYPVTFIEKEVAEKGDKVILPPSALQTLGALLPLLS
jgi:ubiquitin fusion degradation protein 1